jgi:hypothetical protein
MSTADPAKPCAIRTVGLEAGAASTGVMIVTGGFDVRKLITSNPFWAAAICHTAKKMQAIPTPNKIALFLLIFLALVFVVQISVL